MTLFDGSVLRDCLGPTREYLGQLLTRLSPSQKCQASLQMSGLFLPFSTLKIESQCFSLWLPFSRLLMVQYDC